MIGFLISALGHFGMTPRHELKLFPPLNCGQVSVERSLNDEACVPDMVRTHGGIFGANIHKEVHRSGSKNRNFVQIYSGAACAAWTSWANDNPVAGGEPFFVRFILKEFEDGGGVVICGKFAKLNTGGVKGGSVPGIAALRLNIIPQQISIRIDNSAFNKVSKYNPSAATPFKGFTSNLVGAPRLSECGPNQPDTDCAQSHAYERSDAHYSRPQGRTSLGYQIVFVALIVAAFEFIFGLCLFMAHRSFTIGNASAGLIYLFAGVFGIISYPVIGYLLIDGLTM